MPKVLFLADGLPMGGLERQLTLLAKYLPTPWSSMVVAFDGGIFAQKLADLGVSVTILRRQTRFDIKPIYSFWEVLHRERPDIVHAWSWMSSVIAAPICKVLGIRFINGCIRSGDVPKKIATKYRLAFSLSDRIIANSHAGLTAWGIPHTKGKVIYNAIDPQRLDQVKRTRLETNKRITTVVMAARMADAKDFVMFINGAREINRIEPGRWKFIALGDGENRASLLESSVDLVSTGVLEFPDFTDEIIPYLLQADIGVLLTNIKMGYKEGLSNTIMEYMACQLPVICHESGGNSELVIPDGTSFLLESDNVEKFVEKLLWLAHHPDEAGQMGKAGRERIKNLCSMERMVAEYIEVYQDVLNLKSPITQGNYEKSSFSTE